MIRADVSSSSDRKLLVSETLKQLGRIDILINNSASTSHSDGIVAFMLLSLLLLLFDGCCCCCCYYRCF